MIGYSKSLQLLKNRLQPVVMVCTEHLGWGTGRPTSVDRDGLPQPYSDLGLDYSSYILYDLWPDIYITSANISYRYCLFTLVYLGGTIQPRT